eukprot:g38766.t1
MDVLSQTDKNVKMFKKGIRVCQGIEAGGMALGDPCPKKGGCPGTLAPSPWNPLTNLLNMVYSFAPIERCKMCPTFNDGNH